ncbi:hypothetical protein [Streptomyces yaizuensis]|uniref:Uncharacterized protein n=1 Tax=Streptomyces yaizuensis TaxID=2989713 RepID=A0ABQ5P2Y2_9ACTN|nr:hypothetical protein [Streptomyces sp. YSPA8]GLF96576.1 hypothetical protein SYYSPA8_19785 [Streptomyces sp. YSPA8]
MISTDSVNGVARRGRLGRTAAFLAGRRGRRDGARGIPRLPHRDGVPLAAGLAETDQLLVTPYVTTIQMGARRSTEQMRAALIRREQKRIAQLRAESVRVVTQYDIRREPLPAALARYGRWVGEWRTRTDLCRARAQAVVDRANQQLACYWHGVLLEHEPLSLLERRPVPEWLPGRVELGVDWRLPDVWLLDDDDSGASATSRALCLLDSQGLEPRRPPAAVGTGSGTESGDAGRRTRT